MLIGRSSLLYLLNRPCFLAIVKAIPGIILTKTVEKRWTKIKPKVANRQFMKGEAQRLSNGSRINDCV